MNSDIARSSDLAFSLRPTTSCTRNPSFDGSPDAGVGYRKSEFSRSTASIRSPSDAHDGLQRQLALLLHKLDLKRQSVCQRWRVLTRSAVSNNPSKAVTILDEHSRRMKSRAHTLIQRKTQLETVRTSLTRELDETNQAFDLLETMSWNLCKERTSLEQRRQKMQDLTVLQKQWAQERQKTEELVTECKDLRTTLEAKRTCVQKQRESAQGAQQLCEQATAQAGRLSQGWTTRSRNIQEKTQALHALEGELTQVLARTDTEIDVRRQNIGELMRRLESAEARLRK